MNDIEIPEEAATETGSVRCGCIIGADHTKEDHLALLGRGGDGVRPGRIED